MVRNMKAPWKSVVLGAYILLSLCWFASFFGFEYLRGSGWDRQILNFIFAFFMAFLMMKVVISLFMVVDDVRRLGSWLWQQFNAPAAEGGTPITRSDFIQRTALIAGGTLFGLLTYGMFNRYRYKVNKIKLSFDKLPQGFKGMRFVQISDIHSGSFGDPSSVMKGVDIINELKADLVLFTGDIVNSEHEEMDDYMDVFDKIKAPMGVFSILGNHDYSDYSRNASEEKKEGNRALIRDIHKKLGWRLMIDEHLHLERNNDKLALLGVGNISKSFHTYGDLSKAYDGLSADEFKILMSHDPTHWDLEVNTDYQDIDLTLSGHTHGMQFGLNLPGFKWSPVQYMFKQWAGLYEKGAQKIYVNTGFGFLGYPGRVGFLPEITLFEFV